MNFSHPTLKACNSPYMQYYFKRLFVLHFSEVIFSFLIKKLKAKGNRNRNCIFFIPLGIPRVAHCNWIISFMLHISIITSPIQTDSYIDELVEIFLKLLMKTVQVHLIISDDFSYVDGHVLNSLCTFRRALTRIQM